MHTATRHIYEPEGDVNCMFGFTKLGINNIDFIIEVSHLGT